MTREGGAQLEFARVAPSRRAWLAGAGAAISAPALLNASQAAAAAPADLGARVEAIMARNGVPGLSFAIVESGQATFAQGFGVRRLGSAERADADTIFPLGSAGKAFTTAALAILVDRGRIGWDDRVIDRIPGFQMYDPWVTREITIRDLVTHRNGLGLGAGDLLIIQRMTLSRAETVRRMRYMRPATSFRSAYAYSNLGYIAAGQLVEEVTGQTWERFVADNILQPSGMSVSTTDFTRRLRVRNRAWLHARLNGPVRGLGDQVVIESQGGEADLASVVAPAGGICASARDMTRWLQVQLGAGRLPGGSQLWSEARAREMWTAQTLTPLPAYPDPVAAASPNFQAYGLGWLIRDYAGHKIVLHNGAVFGAVAFVVLIPDRDVGFAVMANSEDSAATFAIVFELLDHYLGQPYRDWGAAWAQLAQTRLEAGAAAMRQAEAGRIDAPALSTAQVAGVYEDAWYGPVEITNGAEAPIIDFKQTPGMIGDLSPWGHNTFRIVWRNPVLEPATITFALNAAGLAQSATLLALSPLADFSFDYHDLDLRRVEQ